MKSVALLSAVVLSCLSLPQTLWAAPMAVTVNDPNFEALAGSLPGDNQFNFGINPYTAGGWTEFNILTGLAAPNGTANNVGPINVSPGDIAAQATSGTIALYHQNDVIRVDQTTGHVIAANDVSFTLGVDVGNDASAPRYGGHVASLYADDGVTKTTIDSILGTLNSGPPNDNNWQRVFLTVDAVDLAPYIGQNIGISLSILDEPGAGNGQPVFFDTVTLDVDTAVPEPSTLIAFGLCLACVALTPLVRRRISLRVQH